MIRNYYVILKSYRKGNNYFPLFITCALKEDDYIRIEDLESYLANGEGLSDEVIDTENSDILTINSYDWEKAFRIRFRA